MTQSITRESSLVRTSEVVETVIDDEIVLVSMITEQYFKLSGVGCFVWNCFKEAHSVEWVLKTILETHEVEAGKFESDITDFIQQLVQAQLLIVT